MTCALALSCSINPWLSYTLTYKTMSTLKSETLPRELLSSALMILISGQAFQCMANGHQNFDTQACLLGVATSSFTIYQ